MNFLNALHREESHSLFRFEMDREEVSLHMVFQQLEIPTDDSIGFDAHGNDRTSCSALTLERQPVALGSVSSPPLTGAALQENSVAMLLASCRLDQPSKH
jgi:hypothetical protein